MNNLEDNMPNKLIGLSGTLNAGKDTAAEYLVENYNFMHVSTGDVLRAEADLQNRSKDWGSLIEIGVELRAQYGSVGALVLKSIENWQKVSSSYLGGLVISGLRVIGEAEELKKLGGTLVFIDAPIGERYKRMINRSRGAEANKTYEEFVELERIQMEGIGGDNRPNLKAVKTISDVIIMNNSTPGLFFSELERVLALKH